MLSGSRPKFVRRFVGNRLRQRREELGIPRGMLAQKLDVTEAKIACWEAGFAEIESPDVPQLEAALDASMDEFFPPTSTNDSSQNARLGMEQRLALEIVRALLALPTLEQKRELAERFDRAVSEITGGKPSELLRPDLWVVSLGRGRCS